MQQLEEQLRAEAGAGSQEAEAARLALERYRAGERAAGPDALQVLDELGFVIRSPKARETLGAMRAQARKEQKERAEKRRAELGELVSRALRQALDAKSAAELDAPLASLLRAARAQEPEESAGNPERLAEQARMVLELITAIQNEFAGVTGGAGGERLRQADWTRRFDEFADVMPRSEMLAKWQALQERLGGKPTSGAPGGRVETERKLEDQMRALKSIEEIPALLKWARAETAGPHFDSPVWQDLQALERLWAQYEKLRQGEQPQGQTLHSTLPLMRSGPNDSFAALNRQLMLLAMQRALGLPEESRAKEGELPQAYLSRLRDAALARADWAELERIAALGGSIGYAAIINSSDASGVRHLASAKNLDAAEQFALAVNAYQLALKSGSQMIPVREIGARLQEIRKAHPEEYETGLHLTTTPMGPGRMYPPAGVPGRMPSGTPPQPGRPKSATPATAPTSAASAQEAPKKQ